MSKPILCLDFDGVVHQYNSPWVNAHIIPDPPVPGALDFIKRAQEHFQVHIYSSRSATPEGRSAMQGWLLAHASANGETTDDYVWSYNVIWPETKPPAHITLDDRVWCFTGSWPPIDELLKFKPWNKLGDRAGITVIPNVDAPRYMNLLRDHFKVLQTILDIWGATRPPYGELPYGELPTTITDALAKWPLEVIFKDGKYKLLYGPDIIAEHLSPATEAVTQDGEQKELTPSQ